MRARLKAESSTAYCNTAFCLLFRGPERITRVIRIGKPKVKIQMLRFATFHFMSARAGASFSRTAIK